MRVDIWSDLVCPWCYIGKRRFERALARFEHGASVILVHRAFQLNPAAPRDHQTDRRAMLMRKYRLTAGQAEDMDARMTFASSPLSNITGLPVTRSVATAR